MITRTDLVSRASFRDALANNQPRTEGKGQRIAILRRHFNNATSQRQTVLKKETQHHSTRVTMTAKEQGVVDIDGSTSASSFHAAAAPENQ